MLAVPCEGLVDVARSRTQITLYKYKEKDMRNTNTLLLGAMTGLLLSAPAWADTDGETKAKVDSAAS